MTTISVEEGQARLAEIIDRLAPGEQVIVTRDNLPVATLARSPLHYWPCKAGSAKDAILWISPDFDAPLDEFKEYME